LLRATPVEPAEKVISPTYIAALNIGASESQMNTDDKDVSLIVTLINRFGALICVLLTAIGFLVGAIYLDIRSDINGISSAVDRVAASQANIQSELSKVTASFTEKVSEVRLDIERGFGAVSKDSAAMRSSIQAVSERVNGVDRKIQPNKSDPLEDLT
jgi:hypothetical protein